jgi:hypothetical protein
MQSSLRIWMHIWLRIWLYSSSGSSSTRKTSCEVAVQKVCIIRCQFSRIIPALFAASSLPFKKYALL